MPCQPWPIQACSRSCLLGALGLVDLVGLDLLGWTPFECLPLSPGRSIGLEKAVDWLPSLALGVHFAKRAAAARMAAAECHRDGQEDAA